MSFRSKSRLGTRKKNGRIKPVNRSPTKQNLDRLAFTDLHTAYI
jgi:hypothetical protein